MQEAMCSKQPVILHIPHWSPDIPAEYRDDVLLSDNELQIELLRMTDWHCLVLDIHSFAADPLPYEPCQNPDRPDICISYDDYHITEDLICQAVNFFEKLNFTVSLNTPFGGSMVPACYWQKNNLVYSLMIEINRKLLLKNRIDAKIVTLNRRAQIGRELTYYLYKQPLITAGDIVANLGVSVPTANDLVQSFVELGILREITGFRRNRVFEFTEYVKLFKSE